MSRPPVVTELLVQLSAGHHMAADDLFPLVYSELRDLAAGYMQRERPDHLLQATALVHEAYVKLVDQTQVDWQGRTHFFAVAAKAMQHVLIDHARAQSRQKRGGQWRRIDLNDAFTLSKHHALDVLALEEALTKMAALDERQARVAQLRIFSELPDEHIATLLNVSQRTIERDWKMAKAWLRRELSTGTNLS